MRDKERERINSATVIKTESKAESRVESEKGKYSEMESKSEIGSTHGRHIYEALISSLAGRHVRESRVPRIGRAGVAYWKTRLRGKSTRRSILVPIPSTIPSGP